MEVFGNLVSVVIWISIVMCYSLLKFKVNMQFNSHLYLAKNGQS